MTISSSKQALLTAIEQLGIALTAIFVPWSQSRNASEITRSLNWRVTLHRDGRAILTTDFSCGIGHCPSYKSNDQSKDQRDAISYEIEHGKRYSLGVGGTPIGRTPINPDIVDVVYSLLCDSVVLEHPTYESYAREYDWNPDSRKGEAMYRASLEIALALRVAIGDSGLVKLREAAQDY